ncbi:MAG: helix-turn-helix transcriptional regulator [Pseudomonadota bacterium]
MKFGELLKQARVAREWTQPEACAEIGIEQSYLSKLESGKSVPSEDVYQRLVSVYELDAAALAAALYPAELDRLRSITAVREAILTQSSRADAGRRRWLLGGVVALALGGALIGLAQLGHGGVDQQFTYQSVGVVEGDEPLDALETLDGDSAPELLGRVDERIESFDRYRGPRFIETLPSGGRRAWTLVGGYDAPRVGPYRIALVPGLALLFAGLGCFFVSWRWR